MLNYEQLRDSIITPALSMIQLYSDNAAELLLFTCATESLGGTYLRQINGPALGIYQMEPRTYNDIWQNYIRKRSDLTLILAAQFNIPRMPDEDRMVWDLQFATVMARIYYRRIPEVLPDKNNINALWEYYKKYWNTEAGKATKAESIKHYCNFKGIKVSKVSKESSAQSLKDSNDGNSADTSASTPV